MPQSVGGIAGGILLLGVGIGTLLYYLFSNPESQENSHQHENRPPPRRSPSPPPRQRPAPRSCEQNSSRSSFSSTSTTAPRNRNRDQPGQSPKCFICKQAMANLTVRLNCAHIFDDQCYKVWQELVVVGNPNAGLCPICK